MQDPPGTNREPDHSRRPKADRIISWRPPTYGFVASQNDRLVGIDNAPGHAVGETLANLPERKLQALLDDELLRGHETRPARAVEPFAEVADLGGGCWLSLVLKPTSNGPVGNRLSKVNTQRLRASSLHILPEPITPDGLEGDEIDQVVPVVSVDVRESGLSQFVYPWCCHPLEMAEMIFDDLRIGALCLILNIEHIGIQTVEAVLRQRSPDRHQEGAAGVVAVDEHNLVGFIREATEVELRHSVVAGHLTILQEPRRGEGMDELEAATQIRSTFDQLDTWQAIEGPFRPASGSQMKGDDEDWPPMPTSQVAWMGATASLDHLLAVRWHLDPPRGGTIRLFPFAHQSLCRSALLGAAQSVWVLSPDTSSERIKRSRTVVAFLQDQHLAYLKGLQTWASEPHAGTAAVADHVASRVEGLGRKRTADSQKSSLKATNMIKEAAEETWGVGALAEEVVLSWRAGSGAAHALLWPLLGQPSTVQVSQADVHGRAEFRSGGSFDLLAQSYMAAYQMLDRAWTLMRQRGQ